MIDSEMGTQHFKTISENPQDAQTILLCVYHALSAKGYDPITQIVGYLISGDPTYITGYQNARSLICRIDRDELEELVQFYFPKMCKGDIMNERIVALDVGDRRIGIAVSDALGITAQPIETYTRVGYGPDVRRISQIAQQYETNRILCGLPLNMDGTRGFQAERASQLAEKLEEAGLVVSYYDERMTTVLAEDALLEANMSRENRKKKVDMVAAVMILQSYLDAQAMQNAQTVEDDSEEDEAELDDVLEMEDEDGNVIRFLLNATIPYHGDEYVLLISEDSLRGY